MVIARGRLRSGLHAVRVLLAPRVTVILPTYNWATVLPHSIGSVLSQTFDDFELLVIGDGCTDESEEVARSTGDLRVQWRNLPANTGSQAGPNSEGLRLARGEFVAYLGHDDLWLPRHLERMVAALGAGAAMVHGRQLRVDPRRSPYLMPEPGWQYTRGQWLAPTSFAHRREPAREAGGWRFPGQTGELDPEADLWARISDRHGRPQLVPYLTSVKLPATLRAGIYRARPHHEQTRWLLRIRAEKDPETALLQACSDPPDPETGSASALPDEISGKKMVSAAERQRVRRRFKGLDE